jgi:AraC-like DNA-binding protein
VEELATLLHASDRSLQVKELLDGFFMRHMATPHRDEQVVARIMAMMVDPAVSDLTQAAADVGINARTLRRLSKRYFGFPPKTLMMRSRFLEAFLNMIGDADRAGVRETASTYHDASHFLRDAKRFLGMTAQQFLALETPYLDAALRARALVMGGATPSIDRAFS